MGLSVRKEKKNFIPEGKKLPTLKLLLASVFHALVGNICVPRVERFSLSWATNTI